MIAMSRAQLARGQRREDVLGVGVHAGDERAGALDPGGAQQLVVGRRALEEAHADAPTRSRGCRGWSR